MVVKVSAARRGPGKVGVVLSVELYRPAAVLSVELFLSPGLQL